MFASGFRVRTHSIFLTVAMLAALLIAPAATAADPVPGADFTLTILHNNDGESQLINAGSDLADYGGVARFKTLVDGLRADATANGNGVLMLSSGDNFLAGPEFNASIENGIPFYDALGIEAIGYDAISLGNHDFDFGPDVLADFLASYTSAPQYLNANLDFVGEPGLQTFVDSGVIAPSTVVTTAGEQIGIIGAVTPSLRSISSPRNVVIDFDVAGAIQAEVDTLEAAGINKIVLISHLQDITEDIALAAELSGVDVMIAGGGDELLANPGDPLVPGEEDDVFGAYPLTATGADGSSIPVVTTPGEYKYLGRLSVGFDADGVVTGIGADSGPKVVDGTISPDAGVLASVVDPVVAAIATLDATVIGTSEVDLDGTRNGVRNAETNEGNLLADALLWQARQLAADFGVNAPDVALQNGGGIRNNTVIPAGDITVLDTFDVAPFPNFVAVLEDIPRDQFKTILENAYSDLPGGGRFAQVAGFEVVYDIAGTPMITDDETGAVTQVGSRIADVMLDDGTVIVDGGAVMAGDPITISTIDFLARGGDQYPYDGASFTTVGVSYQQALANYIEDGLGGTISAADYPEGGEGRITELGFLPIEGPFTPIYDIQGSGDDSPLDGETVEVAGYVTGVFPDLGGFYLQDGTGDGDAATSDGIFVDAVNGVEVGDHAEVRGTVNEFFGETRIVDVDGIEVEDTGAAIAATEVSLPLAAGASLEAFEGMLVTFPNYLFVSDTFNLHRFGEAVLSEGGVLVNPTNIAAPGGPAIALAADNAARQIVIDDGSGDQFPDAVPYFGADGTLRRGDAAKGITANLSFSFGAYKLQPTGDVSFERMNPRPSSPDDVGGNLTVASFNVLNFFSTIDDGDNGARGADSAAEKAAQLDKLVAAIGGLGADIIGIQEIENNGPVAIGELIDGLNAEYGAGTWAAAADPDYPGGLETTNAIKVGIIFKTASVTPIGGTEVSEDPVFGADRPPIAHTFIANGDTFTVINNHFKSKSSSNAEGADLDQGDGQGAYNARRTAQAGALLDFTLEMVGASGDGDVLVIGDFNSYPMEDPITTLEGAGFLTNLVKENLAIEDSYSLVFFGAQGLLDGAFATSPLNPKVTGIDIWHINADEPRVLQYNDDVVDPAERSSDFNQPVSQPDVYSSSDHDPIIVGLNLGAAETVATGLFGPRHLSFGPDGTLYVAESGAGGPEPCLTGGDGSTECFGLSGAVTAISGGAQTRIAAGLPSVAADGFAATGPQDVAVAADGTVRALIGLGQDPAVREEILTPAGGGLFGQLVNIGADGSATAALDVAAFEGLNNPDGGVIDSNPNAIVHTDSGYLIADAGANALLKFDGVALSTLAVFPDRLVTAPPFIPDPEIPMQAVPTSVAVGPDGYAYVGELTGFPFPPGEANVYKVDPATGDMSVFASGFTNIIDLEFGPDGSLYVVQISSSGLLSDELDGAVIRVSPDGSRAVFFDELFAPTGIAVDQASGDVYVSNCGICPGFGEVIRLAGVPAAPITLGYSAGNDRANPSSLNGATVSGKIYPFVEPLDPGLGFTTVDFYLDGEKARTEYLAPYDFAGGLLTMATAWHSTDVADGEHTIKAVGNLSDGSTIEASATFTVDNAPMAADFDMAVSDDAYRTNPVMLEGATVFGKVYPFVYPLFPDGFASFDTVSFYLDGVHFHTEYAAPYDFVSGATDKANESWDTTTVADGEHTITVKANRMGMKPLMTEVTFTVANDVGDIVDVAVADGRFTTLVAAVQAAGLEGALRGLGPFTVFAPTDDAFAALPEGTVEALLADPDALADILLYHVAAGKVDAATVVGLTSATTLQGSDITIEVVDGEVILNGTVKVIITDVLARNGIIHVIDGVLLPPVEPIRFATFNASLNRFNAGDLVADLSTPENEQARVIAEIIQRTRPEVLLLNEFDYDADGESARLFQQNYLSVSQNGADPIDYGYAFSAPSNTGIPSGLDLDNSGEVGGPNDAFGFGFFEGQFGMQVYSQYPIDFANVRTFQEFLWADMPGARLPVDPDTGPWYSPEELESVRLSSKSHWDVPIVVGDGVVNFLVSHPTPPVFDGPEDRNGTRNADEIRFWADYVNGADYIYDDAGVSGGWSGDYFVIAGDQNSDPLDGDSIPGSAQQLLDDPRVNATMTPSSLGAVEQDGLQGGINESHLSDPAFDTADFNDDPAPGNLRADYVLPSANLDIASSGVFWPESTDLLFSLVGTFPFPSSDHRLVWVDLLPGTTALPPAMPPLPSIFKIASSDDRFETLTLALEMAGFDTVLDEDGPFTVFAPTDDAFDALPPGLLDDALADPGFLEAILLYHVVEGAVPSDVVVTLTEAPTLLGPPVSIELVDGVVVLDGIAEVIITDIQASNGIIHVIDAVLLPPPPPEPLGFLRSDFGRGSTEVPGPGDPTAISGAFIDVFEGPGDTHEVCFFVNTSVQDPTVAHIHRGVAGESGPVVVDTALDADSWNQDGFAPLERFADGCVQVDQELALEIVNNPGAFYFNVHSVSYPAGATREQLRDAETPLLRLFTAAPLLGSNEVPDPGDPDTGRGFVDFLQPTTDTGEWCYSAVIFRVGEITAGHIHTGAAGEAGGVLLDLEIGSRWPVILHPSGQGWIINGCVPVPASIQSQIAANPGGFYANLHNLEFPAGAGRAQLVEGIGEVIRFAELFPPEGFNPEVNGFANMALFASQGLVCWDTPLAGIDEPTGAFITDANGVVVSFDLVTHPFLPVTVDPFFEYTSFGCQEVDPDTIDAIVAEPGAFTFEVNTATGAPALAGPIFDPQVGPQPPPAEGPSIGPVPPPRDADSIPLPNGFQPEGVAIGNGTDIFAGSLSTGVIYKADLATGIGAPLVIPTDGRTAVGMTVDTRTNYLYVAGGPVGTAFVYDADTGAEMAAIPLNSVAPFETLVNDVIVTDTAAYFTDSFRPVFYRVALGAGGTLPDPIVVEEIGLNTDFPFIPGGINSNGIVAAGDNLIINHTDEGKAFKVDPVTGSAMEIDLGGAVLTAGDGLVLDGTTLYVVQNTLNQIAVIELSADFTSGTLVGTITSPLFRVPTTADQSNGDLYAVNARFDVAPPPFPGAPPADPGLDYDIVRVSKSAVTLPG